jgi:hypothetical protein
VAFGTTRGSAALECGRLAGVDDRPGQGMLGGSIAGRGPAMQR